MLDKKRKEIHLTDKILMSLEHQAKKDGRNLKNYMEYILSKKAEEASPSKEYMKMMDELLEEVAEEKISYVSEDQIRTKYNF